MARERTRVLLVEDNPVDARFLQRTLARATTLNIEVHHVTSMASARRDLRQHQFDAVLLDLMLPDTRGGVETIRALHEWDRDIPVVVLTGRDDGELAVSAMREGAQDYLVKEHCDTEGVVRALRYAIERVRHAADELALRDATRQLQVAGDIQQARLPRRPPAVPGYEIAGCCHTATATGGDYYDFIPIGEGYLGIVIGDASGHGLGPAMVMSDARAILRTLTTIYSQPGEILHRLNKILVRDSGVSMFMTLLLVRLDPSSGELIYSGAGHSGWLLNKAGNVRASLACEIPPLNVVATIPASSFGQEVLQPGETLLLYTDGISEARETGGTLFGEERILEMMREGNDLPVTELTQRIMRAACDFTGPGFPEDDMTIVIVKRAEVKLTA